jgi:hypothetical protein
MSAIKSSVECGSLQSKYEKLQDLKEWKEANFFSRKKLYFTIQIFPKWESPWKVKKTIEKIERFFIECAKFLITLTMIVPAIAFVADLIYYPTYKAEIANQIKILEEQIENEEAILKKKKSCCSLLKVLDVVITPLKYIVNFIICKKPASTELSFPVAGQSCNFSINFKAKKDRHGAEQLCIVIDTKNLSPGNYLEVFERIRKKDNLECLKAIAKDPSGNEYARLFKIKQGIVIFAKKHNNRDADHTKGKDLGHTVKEAFDLIKKIFNDLKINYSINSEAAENLRKYLLQFQDVGMNPAEVIPELEKIELLVKEVNEAKS